MNTTCKSWAKINLLLRVCGRRDDSFHELQTLFQTIVLADLLYFETRNQGKWDVALNGAIEIFDKKAFQMDNLVQRAVKALEEYCGEQLPPLHIRLEKCIPIGAGLGGGSSNAAATFTTLNNMLELGLKQEQLERLGAEIGKDVPFFIRGGTQLGLGRGDQLRPLPPLPSTPLVLVKPEFSISTVEAYGLLKEHSLPPPLTEPELDARITALRQGDWSSMENTFEDVLFDRYPTLARIKAELLTQGCTAALLSGSGSTVFGICTSPEAARTIADHFKADHPFSQPVLNFI